ncbi:hypothetical protein PybrP1_013065 [[Pythium] brassicae (nom. inval.)]|nr:hypothetical protein PybrP1_013065 [[Pythium] brassicae (nom. inval.)]
MVCRLVKSLNGLKQAPRVWNKTLHDYLEKIGLERMRSDYGLYARKVEGVVSMLLTVYLDDLLLLGQPKLCEDVANQLQETFKLTSLGPVRYLLGVEAIVNQRDIMFSQ